MEHLQLTFLSVSGFKAMADTTIVLHHPITILIGPNGSGKSSVLQAIDFASYFGLGTPDQFFADRGWKPSEVRTSGISSPLIFMYFLFEDVESGKEINWSFAWNSVTGETVTENLGFLDGDNFLEYSRKKREIERSEFPPIKGVRLEGSALNIIDIKENVETVEGQILYKLKKWLSSILSLELLSPSAMRYGTRGAHDHIGRRGEHVASFLASLDNAAFERVEARVKEFYPPAESLSTIKKRAGWVDVHLTEPYKIGSRTRLAHLSDGFLRILALAAIPEFGENVSLVLLDEIEDGLDPHIIPSVVRVLRQETTVQSIVTSHSPLLVNFLEPSEITLIARDPRGYAISAMFDEISQLTNDLAFEGPGEIWANTSGEKIVGWVRKAHAAREKE